MASPAGAKAAQVITVDGHSTGRVFDGVGALSAGASSRLLIDYPEPQRSRILDYLFKPGYGASLQILKVEIGGDTNSTDGAEPSHARTPLDLNCDRGYEWWLMEQAKARNPAIKLSVLQWGAPGWVGTSDGKIWSTADVGYLMSFLGCAKQHGLHIDYIGGWNESGYNAPFYEQLHAALRAGGYDTKVVADDSFGWTVVGALKKDPAFAAAVDVIGNHYVCGYLSGYESCPVPSDAHTLGKPLHASEQGSLPYDEGAGPLARAMNRQYIDGGITSTVNWSLIASWYPTMAFQDSGLMRANSPWSGNYTVAQSIWAMAHTAQFTSPGWVYMDSSAVRLAGEGSVVALRSGSGSGDFSVVAETVGANAAQKVKLDVRGGLSRTPLRMWSTDLTSSNPRDWFVRGPVLRSSTVTLEPGHLYTFTTLRQGGHGGAAPPGPRSLALPYGDDFQNYRMGATPRYFSDLEGAFETAPCGGGRAGQCLRQVVTQHPVDWFDGLEHPMTLLGDPGSWRDYAVGVDAMLEQPGWVELVGRIDGQLQRLGMAGIHLRVSDTGAWQLYDQNLQGQSSALCSPSDPSCSRSSLAPLAAPHLQPLASGHVGGFGVGTWHRLSLSCSGPTIVATLDGQRLATVNDPVHIRGIVGLAVSPWQNAQFDSLSVTPLPSSGQVSYLTNLDMSAAATSWHVGYAARNTIDGSVQSLWHTEWSPYAALPQWITLNLHQTRRVALVTYQPREDGNHNGIITQYQLATSLDGRNFVLQTAGTWPDDLTRKEIKLPNVPARYIRLTAVNGAGGYASAADIQVAVPTS